MHSFCDASNGVDRFKVAKSARSPPPSKKRAFQERNAAAGSGGEQRCARYKRVRTPRLFGRNLRSILLLFVNTPVRSGLFINWRLGSKRGFDLGGGNFRSKI